MSSKPKKAAPKKAAGDPPATASLGSGGQAPSPPPPSAPPSSVTPAETAAPDGAERARLNRLAAAGYGVDRCALLGIPLDVGPRAPDWATPVKLVGDVVSDLGARIIASGVDPSRLELAAARLRKKAGDVL